MSRTESGQPVVCIYNSEDGTSRLVDGRIPLGSGERDLWSKPIAAKSWIVAKGLPTGGKDWHRNSIPVLSIVVSGAWEIEAGNGEKRRLDTGSLLAVLDTSGQGHRSRVLDDNPCVVVGIELEGDAEKYLRLFTEDAGMDV